MITIAEYDYQCFILAWRVMAVTTVETAAVTVMVSLYINPNRISKRNIPIQVNKGTIVFVLADIIIIVVINLLSSIIVIVIQ